MEQEFYVTALRQLIKPIPQSKKQSNKQKTYMVLWPFEVEVHLLFSPAHLLWEKLAKTNTLKATQAFGIV